MKRRGKENGRRANIFVDHMVMIFISFFSMFVKCQHNANRIQPLRNARKRIFQNQRKLEILIYKTMMMVVFIFINTRPIISSPTGPRPSYTTPSKPNLRKPVTPGIPSLPSATIPKAPKLTPPFKPTKPSPSAVIPIRQAPFGPKPTPRLPSIPSLTKPKSMGTPIRPTPVSPKLIRPFPLAPSAKMPNRSGGTCGGGSIGDGICSDGSCCSQFGWCGTSSEHCGGNPKKPSAPVKGPIKPPSPSAKGTCGGGSIGDGICSDGSCCSQFGWCGTSSEHCGGNPTKPSAPVKGPIKPPSPSAKGTCGGGSIGDGICPDGSCCSPFGWCGTTQAHCGGKPAMRSPIAPSPKVPSSSNPAEIPNSPFSPLPPAPSPSKTSPSQPLTSALHPARPQILELPTQPSTARGTCGSGWVGDNICADGSCCSQYGWCGSTPEHCAQCSIRSAITMPSNPSPRILLYAPSPSRTSPLVPGPKSEIGRRMLQSGGSCGGGSVGNGICSDGSCCSQFGWCGTSSEHCGGNPTKPSAPVKGPIKPPSPSAKGTCGGGSIGDGICSDGSCCSQFGWCGTSSEHCGGNPTKPSAPVKGPIKPPSPSAKGTCGGGSIGDGICPDGSCCSQFGWCGTSSEYCGGNPTTPSVPAGSPVKPPSPVASGTCGGGSIGDGICPDGSCCSPFGWCGTTQAHCGGKPTAPSPIAPSPKVPNSPFLPPQPVKSPEQPTPSNPTPATPLQPFPPATGNKPPSSQLQNPANPFFRSPAAPSNRKQTLPTVSSPSPLVSCLYSNYTGIINAYSMSKGIIEVVWDNETIAATTNSTVFFDVFVAIGEYDFNATLASKSVEELINEFEMEASFQHKKFNQTDSASIKSIFLGRIHTLLVTAQVDGIYMSNRISRQVTVSTTDPHIKDGINVVGMFIPTPYWVIQLEETPTAKEHRLTFSGAVSPFALNLTSGDFVTGYTTMVKPFICRVVGVIQKNATIVVVRVVHAELPEIFDQLDIGGSFEIAGKKNSVAARRRRLCWICDGFNAFTGAVVGWGKAIGDAVIGVVDRVVDTFKLLTGGEFREEFSVVEVNEQWEYELSYTNTSATNRTTVTATLTAKADLNYDIHLFVNVKVIGSDAKCEAGISVQFYAGASMEMSAGIGTEYEEDFNLWDKTISRVFFVGPVPVEVNANPSIDLAVAAKASLNMSSSSMGASIKGGTRISAIADLSGIRDSTEQPYVETNFEAPTIEGEASLEGSITIILSVAVGVYGETLLVTIGFGSKISIEANANIVLFGESDVARIPVIEDFGINLNIFIPFKASAFDGKVNFIETNLLEKQWVIIALPKIDFKLPKSLRCVQLPGDNKALAYVDVQAILDHGEAFHHLGITEMKWLLGNTLNDWAIKDSTQMGITLAKDIFSGSTTAPMGDITLIAQPKFPPFLKMVKRFPLQSLLYENEVQCKKAGPCDGGIYFDRLSQELSAEFNSKIFLSQQPDPKLPLVPSKVYKFEDFMGAMKQLRRSGDNFKFWLGDDDCSIASEKAALVNIAAFLGQSIRETIIYDACDENNWDLWRADVFKEPTSPAENLAALYPMSSGCGQLGQNYAAYRCEDECPVDLSMDITATTNAGWIGAPPPLFCGPKSKYDGLGYWNPQKFCNGTNKSCQGQQFYYDGQTAGVHVPVSEDGRFPEYFFTHPLADSSGSTPAPRTPDDFPLTNVEGCCWWGRGVIQTTGRCNFGKLNKYLGAGAGSSALYPNINFCKNPQSICNGPSELKWIAGVFYWVSEPQSYNKGFNFKDGVKDFVRKNCTNDMDRPECDVLFEYASGIVNRGCHNPGENGGCPGCTPGATCGPAHNVPERIQSSKQVLKALMPIVNATK